MSGVDRDGLRAMPLLARFSDAQLDWLLEHADEVTVGPGVLAEPGATLDAMHILVEGDLHVFRVLDGQRRIQGGSEEPGVWFGLPTVSPITQVGALTNRPSRLLRIARDDVQHMVNGGFPIAEHLLAGLGQAMPAAESMARQSERLAVLGKLSAGLAHELNNPAAAARRAAASLREVIGSVATTSLEVGEATGWSPQRLLALREEVAQRAAQSRGGSDDPLARSDAEDELGSWLDEHDVDEAWDLAPDLVEAGLDVAWLEQLAGQVEREALGALLAWVRVTFDATGLVGQVEVASRRLSDLVGAMKDYSHMDRAPQSDVDVAASLDSTLQILAFKLRGVAVERDYDARLPRITAYGGELTSVWTNLLDNAVDALAGVAGPRIVVRATCDGERVLVEVTDNGGGIPEELRTRIFDPFFTTKGVGEGTGLGLDTVYRIVVVTHGGEIDVESEPGHTTFRVRLPQQPPERPGGAGPHPL